MSSNPVIVTCRAGVHRFAVTVRGVRVQVEVGLKLDPDGEPRAAVGFPAGTVVERDGGKARRTDVVPVSAMKRALVAAVEGEMS